MQFTKIIYTLVAGACYGTSSPAPDGNCSSASDNIALIQRQASVQAHSADPSPELTNVESASAQSITSPTQAPDSFGPYVKGPRGGVCPKGLEMDEYACKTSAAALGRHWRFVVSYGPSGCWEYGDRSGIREFYFNPGISNTVENAKTPFCQASQAPVYGNWNVKRTHATWNHLARDDSVCGKNTDVLSIASVSSKWCKNKHGSDGQAIVNQDGAELSFAWFCSNQGTTTIVGTPTFVPEEGDGPCAHQHQVGDQGN